MSQRLCQAEADLLALMAAAPGAVDLREVKDRSPIIACWTAKWIDRAKGAPGYVITARGRKELARLEAATGTTPVTDPAADQKPRVGASAKPMPAASPKAEALAVPAETDFSRRKLLKQRAAIPIPAAPQPAQHRAEPERQEPLGAVELRQVGARITFPPSGRCVWPIGDPDRPNFNFCGERICAPGEPYCREHFLRAHNIGAAAGWGEAA